MERKTEWGRIIEEEKEKRWVWKEEKREEVSMKRGEERRGNRSDGEEEWRKGMNTAEVGGEGVE